MKQFSYTITDPQGIHARPAGLLIKEAARFQSSIRLQKEDKVADAKRIFAVMGLTAKQGAVLEVTIEGPDEADAATALEAFFKENL